MLVLNALLADADLDATLAAERELPAGDVLKDITVSDGALILTQRSELDYLVEMDARRQADAVALRPLRLRVRRRRQAPATLVPDGDFWTVPSP